MEELDVIRCGVGVLLVFYVSFVIRILYFCGSIGESLGGCYSWVVVFGVFCEFGKVKIRFYCLRVWFGELVCFFLLGYCGGGIRGFFVSMFGFF